MTIHPNPWNEARQLQATLIALGVEEGEIAFPESAGPCAGVACFVSENLSGSAELTPSMATRLRDAIRQVHSVLEGYSVSLQEGRLSVHQGDSGGFLEAWCQCPVLNEENVEELCAQC